MKRITLTRYACALLLPLLLGGLSFAWDGEWTNAKSGRTGLFDDPGSSNGQAGTDPPQKYYTAAPRDFADVDPEELDDYFHRHNKDYAPYALARITQDLHYNQLVVPKGYYLVKAGDFKDGSQRVTIDSLNGPPLPESGLVPIANAPDPQPVQTLVTPHTAPMQVVTVPPSSPVVSGSTSKGKKLVYETLMIKRQGKVVMVVPIHRRQMYIPARKDKIPNRALAWVEQEDRHPVLKFYFHHWIYSTDFQ